MDEKMIIISEKLDPHLGMNFTAKELFDEINSSDISKYVFDFSNVIFMSRSLFETYVF